MSEVIGKSYSLTTLKKYFRVVGFFPYDLVQKGDRLSVKFSLKYLAWSYFLGTNLIILGSLGVFFSFISLRYWFSPAYINESMVVYIVHLNFMFNIVGAFICIIYTTFSRKTLNAFINNIMKADRLMEKMKIPVKKNKWSKLMALMIVIAIMIVIIADSTSYFLIFDQHLFLAHILRKLPYFSSYFFSVAQTYMFWSLVLLIKARICAIKSDLQDPDAVLSYGNLIMVKEFESVLIQQKKLKRNNYKGLQNVYIHLFDAARALDELVRPIIVLSFVIRFFALLITPFILYVQVTGYKSTFFIFPQTCWALGQFSSLALIVEPADCCRKEYDELKRKLSRLISGEIYDGDLVLLYDLVKALPIEFYINDATPLRRILYVSILGSLTTYLVVLFQMAKNN